MLSFGQFIHKIDPRQIPHEVQQVAHMGPQELQKFIHDEFQHLLIEGAGEIAHEALKGSRKAANAMYQRLHSLRKSRPDLVSAIDDVEVRVQLSVVTLGYSGFYGRAEGLLQRMDDYVNDFHLTRTKVRWFITNTGPTWASLDVSGELFTSAISAGAGITVPTTLLVELVDAGLEAAGVPA